MVRACSSVNMVAQSNALDRDAPTAKVGDVRRMLHPNFDPAPTAVRIHRCKYVSQCKARSCLKRATLIAEKIDVAGRHVRQIELCARTAKLSSSANERADWRFPTDATSSGARRAASDYRRGGTFCERALTSPGRM